MLCTALIVILSLAVLLSNAGMLVVLLFRLAEERRDVADTLRLQTAQLHRASEYE